MEKGPPYDPVPEIAPHLPEIEEHFLRWLEQLDDAMRDPTDLKVPSADFPPSANWILNSDQPFFFHALWDQMEEMSLDGFVPRDHLERKDPEVLEVANAVQNSLSRRLHLLGPLREDPTPVYRPGDKGTGITTLGQKGENTVAYLDERGGDLVVCPLHLNQDEDQSSVRARSEEMRLRDAVVYWLEKLGIAGDLRLQPVGRMLEFDLVDQQTRDRRDLTSVGVGASQILPVVVLCLVAEPGDLVLLEQPELHLHPKPQQVLGDFLLGIAQTGRQLIVETHSEYLVNRLRRRMVEQGLEADEDMIRLLYAKRENGSTSFDELRPNKFGSFDSWPEGFFDQSRESQRRLSGRQQLGDVPSEAPANDRNRLTSSSGTLLCHFEERDWPARSERRAGVGEPIPITPARVVVSGDALLIADLVENDAEVLRFVASAEDPVAATRHCLQVGARSVQAASAALDSGTVQREFDRLSSDFGACVGNAIRSDCHCHQRFA